MCRVYSVIDHAVRIIPRPIYTISPDGRFGSSVDFRRIDNMRPGYGYDGLSDPYVAERAPQDSGIWRVDLETGDEKLILSLADAAAIPWDDGDRREQAWHYFNHLLINPAGNRFIALHRYRPEMFPVVGGSIWVIFHLPLRIVGSGGVIPTHGAAPTASWSRSTVRMTVAAKSICWISAAWSS